jgi:hypothetical protein
MLRPKPEPPYIPSVLGVAWLNLSKSRIWASPSILHILPTLSFFARASLRSAWIKQHYLSGATENLHIHSLLLMLRPKPEPPYIPSVLGVAWLNLSKSRIWAPNVVFFRSGESALGLDKTALPEWGDGKFAYVMPRISRETLDLAVNFIALERRLMRT